MRINITNYNNKFNKFNRNVLTMLLITFFLLQTTINVSATDLHEEAELRKSLPIQTNEIENWPAGPEIGAEGAILMDADTGTILYGKNIDAPLYPASITKMLTCLLAIENCSLDEIVTFSKEAVFGIEPGSSNAGIDVGEQIDLEECLYIILLYSANEVTAGVGEHVAGTIDGFVDMMNERAKELGCTNSNFANTNGLPDENHYTSPRDFALIAQAFYANETLCKISSTARYHVNATPTQPDEFDINNKHQMCQGLSYEYDGFVGGKTGYTIVARQTLVSCAERDGMRLICVIMKEESPNQFKDTIELFDYGFTNFDKLNIAENETKYTIGTSDFFTTNSDIFGSSKPIISIDSDDYIILPKTADFADIETELTYDIDGNTDIANIIYSYNGVQVGSAKVTLAEEPEHAYDFDGPVVTSDTFSDSANQPEKVIFINVIKALGALFLTILLIFLTLLAVSFLRGYHFGGKRRRKKDDDNVLYKKRGRKLKSSTTKRRTTSEFKDFDF